VDVGADGGEDSGKAQRYLVGGEADDSIAHCEKGSFAGVVELRSAVVGGSVDLDHQAMARSEEVDDEAAEHVLSTELHVVESVVAQRLPKAPFRSGFSAAKLGRSLLHSQCRHAGSSAGGAGGFAASGP
jgi:hypothetical protein